MSYYTSRLLVACLIVAAAAPALAGDNLIFGGGEVSGHDSSYGQVGVVTPLPGNTMSDGWAVRATTDALTYKYRATQDIKATGAGGQVTLGYQEAGAPGWWAFFTGPVFQYTHLSPDDPASRARGGVWGWIAQGEGEYFLTKNLKGNLGGSYIFAGNDAFWTRLRLLYRVSGQMFVGPEGIYQGDSDYRAWELGGGLFGIALDADTQLGLHAGVRKVQNFAASPYGGLEVGRSF